MKTYDAYNDFAWVYERHWGSSSTGFYSLLKEHLLGRCPREARILDLCCGTGNLAAKLAAEGYRVQGIDGSSQMLRYARQRAPKVRFRAADARRFKTDKRFDAVISTFDSLNHIMRLTEMKKVFRCVRKSLTPSGHFFFDLNMEEKYLRTWSGSFAIVADDHVCAVRSGCSPKARTADFRATIFRKNRNSWRRTDVVLVQTWYSAKDIRGALKDAGFQRVLTRYLPERSVRKARMIFRAS